jgi:hypothetical protein
MGKIRYRFRYGRERCECNDGSRVLPGDNWYAGGIGPEYRYRQPGDLSYHHCGRGGLVCH